MDHIRTNILFFDLVAQRLTNDEFVARLKEQGVLLHHAGPSHFRMVIHYGISAADIATAIEALRAVMRD
jgi:threonine aldolase